MSWLTDISQKYLETELFKKVTCVEREGDRVRGIEKERKGDRVVERERERER